MAFHFCAHTWEVRDMDDGTHLLLSQRDLDLETAAMLVDDLVQIVKESGHANLYLDFTKVQLIPSVILAKMVALDQKLREHDGRLIVQGLRAAQYEMFEATRLTEKLDVRRAD